MRSFVIQCNWDQADYKMDFLNDRPSKMNYKADSFDVSCMVDQMVAKCNALILQAKFVHRALG